MKLTKTGKQRVAKIVAGVAGIGTSVILLLSRDPRFGGVFDPISYILLYPCSEYLVGGIKNEEVPILKFVYRNIRNAPKYFSKARNLFKERGRIDTANMYDSSHPLIMQYEL